MASFSDSSIQSGSDSSIRSESDNGEQVKNFMGGKSYKLNPLQSLQIVCTSMICGEAQYYRRGNSDKKNSDSLNNFLTHFLFPAFYDESESSATYFDKIVNDALDYDFAGSVQFVGKLRNEYLMRLNSNYLLTKAVHHSKRVEFNKTNPIVFKNTIESVGCLPTDWTTQFKLLKESGKPIPTIWKRAIATKLENMTAYHAAKYLHGSKTTGKVKGAKPEPESNSHDSGSGSVSSDAILMVEEEETEEEKQEKKKLLRKNLANIVDLIRITHPKPTEVITQLVKTGKVEVADDEQTWEKLRSAKKTWQEINAQIRLPHMALLRNLRNIMQEYSLRQDAEVAIREIEHLAEQLVKGVSGGKQFPFRYFSAYKMLKTATISSSSGRGERLSKWSKGKGGKKAPVPVQEDQEEIPTEQITAEQKELHSKILDMFLDALNRCVLESVESIPPMKGRVDCLSDNSGSSRGSLVSEYGTVSVFEIANLSAILTAYRATEGGSVWIFGDGLAEYEVTKDPILEQLETVNEIGQHIGGGTETGVWLFWEKFILNGKQLDTVFIYSDMQAGTGGLYADNDQSKKLVKMGAAIKDNSITYIDVLKLIEIYRERVHSKVNVFSVQVAGYDNNILPDILYRGAILSGWTGKEAKLAYEMNELWDSVEDTREDEDTRKAEW